MHTRFRGRGAALPSRSLVVGLGLGLLVASARADTVSYQKGDGKGTVSDTKDTTITPSTANQATDVTCGVDQTGPHDHCLLTFPNIFGTGPNQIPPGSTILSATLTLYVENDGADNGLSCPQLFQLTEDWNESQATWDLRVTGTNWAVAGADAPPSRKAVAEGIIGCDPIGFYSIPVTTSVRNWSNGEPNRGWVLIDQGPGAADGIDFTSSEGVQAQRPQLSVTFVPETPCEGGNALWWNTDWGRRRKVRFDNSGQAQNLDDFPVLIRLDGTRVDYAQTQNLGQDIRFVDQDHTSVLAHEIEQWNEAGSSYVWVRVPRVSGASANDFVWMYYGNAGALDGQNPAGVWDASHRAVWHLKENPAGAPPQFLDSTANPNDGTVAATAPLQVAGQVHFGLGFTLGTDRHVAVTDHASLQLATSMTVSAWFRTTIAADVSNRVIVTRWGAVPNRNYWLGKNGASLSFYVDDTQSVATPLVPWNDGAWHHIVGVADAANSLLRIYVDGVQRNTAAYTGTSRIGVSQVFIGANPDIGNQDWDGSIDEARVESAARSADWLRAQYLSMTDSFVSVGAEVGSCNVRSIGTRLDYGTLATEGGGTTVSVTQGSRVVSGSVGTTWLANNRGRGDRININGVDYTVFSVNADNSLQLTSTYRGGTASGVTYRIFRQYGTLASWEDCVDGPPGTPCPFFPVVSASLVADNRAEIGVAYKDSVFTLLSDLVFQDSVTDASRSVTLTADPPNRHNGTAGAGVVVDQGTAAGIEILIQDSNVTVEWLETVNTRGNGVAALKVVGAPGYAPRNVLLQNLLVHAFRDAGVPANDVTGIMLSGDNVAKSVTIRNTMIWDGDRYGIWGDEPTDTALVENCTIDQMQGFGINTDRSSFVVRNTIATSSFGGAVSYARPAGSLTGSHNTASDTTASAFFTSFQDSVAPAALYVTPNANLHLIAGAIARDTGLDLSASFQKDIDGAGRPVGPAWDRGADEFGATTAVTLQSFSALAQDAAVELSWRTASELDNLGFHLYRGLSESGPWTRITTSLVPGLGSSPTGAFYSRLDSGLSNGVRYFYRLEDVDTRSLSTFHGPVAAVPQAGSTPSSAPEGGEGATAAGLPPCGSTQRTASRGRASRAGSVAAAGFPCVATYGDPSVASLRVVSRDPSHALVELVTGGFYAVHDEAGRVRVSIPGFVDPEDAHAVALPFKRALLEAEVGRSVRIASVRPLELERYPGLLPGAVGHRELDVRFDGTVRPGWRRAELRESGVRELARLAGTVFQGEQKRVALELSPLRFDQRGLVLAKRLVVRVHFTGREAGERGERTRGRRPPRQQPASGETLAFLHTTKPGLHAVAFETLFPTSRRALALESLRLERQGEPVAFHVAPSSRGFGPGSALYFHADRAPGSLAFAAELSYALVRGSGGLRMGEASAAPAGPKLGASLGSLQLETNRFYQAGLLEAADLWQWEALVAGPAGAKLKAFVLEGVDASSSEPGRLRVWLQGGSDAEGVEDHHVRAYLGPAGGAGVLVGEARFDGKRPYRLEASVPAGLLREGENELRLENVGDTGVYSLVFLDRFQVDYRQAGALRSGVFEGVWSAGGTAQIAAASSSIAALDVTDATRPVWLAGLEAGPGTLRFGAQAGRRYLLASSAGLIAPRVTTPPASSLKSTTNQADYLLIAPRAFLAAAQPLVERRESQGLRTRLASLEEIASVFGQGEPSAEAIRGFLAYAYHSWQRPSPRYVLLLGDASSDPRNFTGTAGPAPLPALFLKTSYLWTASDPALVAVNGDDLLPDLALGRLPARSIEEAQALVAKLLAWEDSGQGLSGKAVLVADNPDEAGDFEWNVDDIRASFLAGRETTTLRLRELGAATRPAILDAFDAGASLVSYVGHGGAAVWASENVLNSWDVAQLQAQSRQPLMLTMNCLNGYFVAPAFDSLAEAYLKAEGRGSVAAFSPSGLSLDAPAHQLHRALIAELTSGAHERLGDAVLAAQAAYAASGQMPELLSIYHLLADPALVIR